MKLFLVALGALALVHTLVSFAAYRFLAETKVLSAEQLPDIETTTSEQRAKGTEFV
jgi:hypothetical protein